MKIKVGDFLTAKKDLFMNPTKVKELTKGEKYEILEISKLSMHVSIINNSGERHSFDLENLNEYFEGWVNKPNLEVFEKHKELFNHMDKVHGVMLLESELQEIAGIVAKEIGLNELLDFIKKAKYTHFYDMAESQRIIEKYKPIEVFRKCPNCGNNNTKEESCNKYVCKYCEGEIDTEF